MKPTKNKYLIIAAVCWIMAVIVFAAHAAGPATNVVTLAWTNEVQVVPYFTEIQQSASLTTPNWTVLASVPAPATNYTFSISKDLLYFRVRLVNATNTAWFSDFSNTASTLWPVVGGNLSIRLGP